MDECISNFATQSTLVDHNLESSLRRIDHDVRRSGRISRRDIEDVLEEIRLARSATSSQSLLMIRCCGNLVPEELPDTRTKLVQEIWNTLKKLGVPMDVSHYNALLRVYLENEHPFSPTDFLSELESNGIEPNRVTYQRLIARYCQDGDIEGATKILEYMREKQMSVNENVFNALIVGHSKSGDMDSAQGIINVMIQAGLEPSADTYTTLLGGYAAKGDIEMVNKLIAECDTKEIFLLDKDLLDIVYSLATNGHTQHIPTILAKVRKSVGYNQDAINLILRLVNRGYEEAAFMILKSMQRGTKEDGSPAPTGAFFVRQLVKAKRPLSVIIDFCTRLEEEGMYEKGILRATETSLELGYDEIAYPLMEKLQSHGIPVRQHYFWPLILSKASDTSGKSIIEVLQKMRGFGIFPSTETVREYVIPNLKGSSSDILAILRDCNISVGSAASSLVISLLQKNEIKEAAAIATRVQVYYNPEFIRRPLTNSFYKTYDIQSYIDILRAVHEGSDRRNAISSNNKEEDDVEDERQEEKLDNSEIVGTFILDLSSNHRKFVDKIDKVLEKLVEHGLSISTPIAEKIQEKMGEKMTNKISTLLGKLSSGELTPVPLLKKPPIYTPSHQMNIDQLETLIGNLEAKNQETKGLKRQLFTLYCRAKELEKAEKLMEVLQKGDFVFTTGIYAQLIDLYAHHGHLEKAMENYEKIKETEQENFMLDDTKLIKLANLLVNSGRFEDGINILENTKRDITNSEKNFNYISLLWRFLNGLAEEGKVEELNKLFNVLVKKEFMEPNNVLLGPLIKVYLVNKELDKAVDKFEWCVNQYKVTPWKNELACQLIQAEDADRLQKLTDLSTTVHGEVNSLYDLVFAFVECGRIRQARKILETPGLQSRPQRINSACERYQQEGLIKPLEGLKDATKDLNHIDRSDIYFQLLLSYMKQDDTEKALGLWTQMQEEDLAPTDMFLNTLGSFLQKKGQHVPFVVPKESSSEPTMMSAEAVNSQNILRNYLKRGTLNEALELVNTTRDPVTIVDLSNLIEKLVQSERLSDAADICIKVLNKGKIPTNRVFRFLLNKLANNGDVDTLSIIGSKIDSPVKRNLSFDNRMCQANLVAGKAHDYLQTLNDKIEKATEKDLDSLKEQFPRGGAYGILEKYPHLSEQYEDLAIKYAKKGIIGPLNVLWTYFFICGNDQKAEQIWNDYLKNSPRIMFQKIVQISREESNEELVKKLIQHLKTSNVTEGAIGNAYSCLLDVLVNKQKYEEVVSTFEQATKEVSVNHINRTAVLRAKEAFEKLGKSFNYIVPPRTNKSHLQDVEESS
ncbi:bicoid stability factor isoform X2 [Leptinotarsa decemlineata]|uniref:bicoid stability factor isoform X2 n=1 Tax=Leptinotarsa decemlineata TaxID=7539 RepID=UPI003D3062FD